FWIDERLKVVPLVAFATFTAFFIFSPVHLSVLVRTFFTNGLSPRIPSTTFGRKCSLVVFLIFPLIIFS
ncbi:MAG: hypothetical protein D6711_00080, partial [Chloroflexi bacterium]